MKRLLDYRTAKRKRLATSLALRGRLTLLVVASVSATSCACAEDKIILRTASGSRIGVSCSIIDYTGREVSYIARSGGATKRTPRREVIEVTTHYNVPHNEARELFAKGEAQAAFQKLETALEQENRVWVRREILATQVKCALWQGDRVMAGERFLAIVESDPETLYFPLMPLSWNSDAPSADLVRAAKLWKSQTKNSAAVLLGASHLLTAEPESRAALAALKELAKDGRAEIQRYGQMQLWRAKVLTEDVSKDELLRWERTMDEAGDALGGGPRYLLGLGWQRRQDDLAAAAAWLWLPLVSAEDRWLAADAAWNAGTALRRAGQMAESQIIFDEIATRFADTPFAAKGSPTPERPRTK